MKDLFLMWCDIETTGLAEECGILEVAYCFSYGDTYTETDAILVAPHTDCRQESQAMEFHRKNGLLDADSTVFIRHANPNSEELFSYESAQAIMVNDLRRAKALLEVPDDAGKPMLAGSSIAYDMRMLNRYMSRLTERLHYRLFDVSCIHNFVSTLVDIPERDKTKKESDHRAKNDIERSIEQYLELVGLVA